MPRFDGTGPIGNGSRTGRGMGFCGERMRNFFCRGCRFQQTYSIEDELAELKSQEIALEKELVIIRERITRLEK